MGSPHLIPNNMQYPAPKLKHIYRYLHLHLLFKPFFIPENSSHRHPNTILSQSTYHQFIAVSACVALKNITRHDHCTPLAIMIDIKKRKRQFEVLIFLSIIVVVFARNVQYQYLK